MDALLSSRYIQASKFGVGPDFSIHTGAMHPVTEKDIPVEDLDKPVLKMRGSSVVEDLQGDIMQLTALQDMTKVASDLTFWLNHSYELPDDAYGKMYGHPTIQVQNTIADLWVAVETFISNSKAEKTYNLIKREGARFGCSIGCMVTDWSWLDPDDPWMSGISIDHVYTVEFSIVGVPANQRCWVENAIKGMFARSLVNGNGDMAKSLAPAFRGLFSKQYEDILRNVTSEGLRKDLESIPLRDAPSHRIIYDFDGTEGFALRDNKGTKKSLHREDIPTILEQYKEKKTTSGNTNYPQKEDSTNEPEEGTDKKEKIAAASEVSVSEDGSHEVCTGTHSHSHKAYGDQGSDEMHKHSHSHDGDSAHGHNHEKSQEPEVQKDVSGQEPIVQHDALRVVYHALLDQANAIGKQLGLSPVGEETQKAIIAVNIPPQDVITLLSSIDSQVDTLMAGFGIPDIDETYSIDTQVRRMLESFFKIAEGRELSDKNKRILQSIHDGVKSMHPAVCGEENAMSIDDLARSLHPDTRKDMTLQQVQVYQESMEKQLEVFTRLTEAIESVTAKDLIEGAISNAFKKFRIEQEEIVQMFKRLKDMPLGRPTNLVGRTVEPQDEGVAHYHDFLQSRAGKPWSLEEALAQTIVEEYRGMPCRRWEDGIGGDVSSGVRPRLTEHQKTYMSPSEILRYNKGEKAFVPEFNR